MPRQNKRPTDFELRQRTVSEIQGWPGDAGKVRVGGLPGRGGSRSVVADGTADYDEGSNVGQLLVMSATGDSIAPGGDYLTFDAEVYRQGFGSISTDGQSVTWPTSAVGAVQVEFEWDAYQGGGTVEIEVNGQVPTWGLVVDGTAGQTFVKRRGVDLAAGDSVKILVTHADASAQTADALVEFSIQDPVGGTPDALADLVLLETLWVDHRTTGSTSTTVLRDGSVYRVVVAGNLNGDFDTTMTFGTTDPLLHPSPGQPAGEAQADAEFVYAGIVAGSYPSHWAGIEVDTGAGFVHPEPLGGQPTSPSAGHSYTYRVTGAGSALSVRSVDTGPRTDNNGQLKVDIYGPAGG